MNFSDLPMQQKMMRIIFSVAGGALLVAALAVLLYESTSYRPRVEREVDTLADLYSELLPASLDFNDPVSARQYLGSLRFRTGIELACVYQGDGRLFTSFAGTLAVGQRCPKLPSARRGEQVFSEEYLDTIEPIEREGETIGWLFLRYRLQPLYTRLPQYGIMVGMVVLTLFVVSVFMTYLFGRYITKPLNDLSSTAVEISETKNYSLRAKKVGRDELGSLTDALNLLLATTEESIRLRDDFLSIASHELKTPLTPIRTQLELLDLLMEDKDANAPEVRQKLRHVTGLALKQVDRITRLIDNLLDVSRITAGRFSLCPEPVNLSVLVSEVSERFRPEFEKKHSALALTVEPAVSGRFDLLRVEEVVINLLTNALKYGAGKPVEVRLKRAAGAHASLTVTDHGIGVVGKDQQRIFERFERAVSLQSFGGLGLGLYISRQIVEAHGGRIRVESKPGEGSTFTVELPLTEQRPS